MSSDSGEHFGRRELFERALRGGRVKQPRAPLPSRTLSLEDLPARAAERRLARLSTHLRPGRGAASFGGRTLLAKGVEWPTWRECPLTFLAQAPALGGRLLLFYETGTLASGFKPAHRGCGCALLDSGSSLVEARGPALPTRRVGASSGAELVLPRVYSAAVEELDLRDEERVAWERERERLAAAQGTVLTDRHRGGLLVVHRLLGYPDDTRGDMPLICELCDQGEDARGGRPWLHPRAGELEARSSRWELLAQLSADEELGWSWGERRLYFWVDRDALAGGDLSRAWTILR